MADTPEEHERLARRACPHCGCERENFKPRNRNAICCQPPCSDAYWSKERPTIAEMRRLVYDEQGGKCAGCKLEIHDFNATEGPYGTNHPYVLDHLRPIAMGGSQWARKNMQVLCERCNKEKTARDMGRIASWKRHHKTGIEVIEDRTQQVPLFGTG